MKIKTKLLLGLSTLPILFLLLVGVGWFRITNFNEMKETLNNTYQSTFLAEKILLDFKNESIAFRNIMILTDTEAIQKEWSTIQTVRELINEDILLLESMVRSIEQKAVIENLKVKLNNFNDFVDNGIQLVINGERDRAIQLINEFGHQNQNELHNVIREMTRDFEENMTTILNDLPKDFQNTLLVGSIITLIGSFILMLFLLRNTWTITFRLRNMSTIMANVANGKANLDTRIESKNVDEIDHVANSFNHMTEALSQQIKSHKSLNWIKSNIAEITTKLTEAQDLKSLSRIFLSTIAPLVEACHATFYIKASEPTGEPILKSLSCYAYTDTKDRNYSIRFGEGLVGQAALENSPIFLSNVPSDYLSIKSGLGEAKPMNVTILPISVKGEVNAVVEIASFQKLSSSQQTLLDEMIGNLEIILESVMSRIQLANLLQESQALMEELQVQSEELQSQQEELRATNEELEEQTVALRESEKKLQAQQEELEQTNAELIEKAESLEIQNKKFEATNREIEYAKMELEETARELEMSSKYKSEFLANMSHELRTPLNSLLILSKLLSDNVGGNLSDKQIEYAKTIYSSGNDLLQLINDILDLAKIESGKMDVHLGDVYITDLADHVEKSFRPIANEKGIHFNVVIQDHLPTTFYSDEKRIQQVLKNLLSNAFKFTLEGSVTLEIGLLENSLKDPTISFAVIDTGIGVHEDNQKIIFEAFHQADGTTSRKFGGTGLGLSISRELSNLLGGEIVVESIEGKGSKFIFNVGDFNTDIQESIENELPIEEVAVTIETVEPMIQKINKKFIQDKNDNIKRMLIVEDDLSQRNSLMELVGDKNVIISAVATGIEALELFKVNQFDLMILDLGLKDITGFDLLKKIKSDMMNDHLKVFIFTGCELTSKEEIELKKYVHTIIIKDAHSPQRLLEELELCLSVESDTDEANPSEVNGYFRSQSELEGKKVLLVDDDVRNVFALSSILEANGMIVTFAENGYEALVTLEDSTDLDIVLMDIMMPEMDGYEAMQRIRKNDRYKDIPIIALTAKAMKEDRELCITSGASDYIAKPVDPDQLISLITVWLHSSLEEKNRLDY